MRDRRLRARRDFDEVEADATRVPERFLDAHHSQLLVGYPVDHAHFAGADAFVDTNVS
jgi:hypothetical protein